MVYCNAVFALVLVSVLFDWIRTQDMPDIGDQSHSHRRRTHQNERMHRSYEGIVFPSARNLYCYSCMSKRLESNWEFLWQMYRRPEQFSETCDPEQFRRGLVKLRNCTDYCIWIAAETQVFGQKIPIYTRGCMSDVLNYRQDDARLSKLRRKNGCTRLLLSELFNDGERKIPNNEPVELCACHSSYCNPAPSTAPRSTALLIPLILIASGFWRC